MLLIKFEDNWADEMDIYGFKIMTKKQWEYKKYEIRNSPFPQEVCFGTNEYNVYETPKEFLSRFKEKDITESQHQVFKEFFRSDDYGRFPVIEGCAPNEFYEKYGYYPESGQ